MNERPRTLLQFGLTLLPKRESFEDECLQFLSVAAMRLDGILLSLPSWPEVPDALSHPLVIEALGRCSQDGLDVYWGRDLWIRWKDRAKANKWTQRKGDFCDPTYYAAFLSRLDAEAKAIGAKGTFAECEPYGDKHHTAWFKTNGFTSTQFWLVLNAITEAKRMAPGVTIAKPAGSSNPNHYGFATRYLGDKHLCTKTDCCRQLSDLKVNAPRQFPLLIHWWRTALTTVHNSKPDGRLNVAEWSSIDWAEIKRKRPELLGRVIKIEDGDMVEVLQQLGEVPVPDDG